jgi:hypothetical protein
MQEGPCSLFRCTVDYAEQQQLGAGTIVVSSPEAKVSLVDNSPGQYSLLLAAPFNPSFWKSAGETITAQASGGDIPAFTLNTTSPGSVMLTSPALPAPPLPATMPVAVSTSQDFPLTWSGAGPGHLDLTLRKYLPTNSPITITTELRCQFDPASGQGDVPASLLGQVGSGGSGGQLYLQLINSTTMNVDGYSVELIVGDDLAVLNATFQ